MNKKHLITLLTAAVFAVPIANAKQHQKAHVCDHYCELIGTGVSNKSFVPPVFGKYSKIRHQRNEEAGIDTGGLQLFEVTYEDAVPEEARTCVEYALSIWESHISSSQKMIVHVKWDTSDESSALASAGPSGFYAIEENSLLPTHYSPVGIYNRKTKSDATPGRDIGVTIVGTNNFYYGTDGNCPENQYDLVTTILHELGHGLGFISSADREISDSDISPGSLNYNGTLGFGAGIGLPFDYFLQNIQGKYLIDEDSYENPSKNLYTALTNNNLFFDSPLTRAANGGNPAKLYAPTLWNDGSSVSHLDEGTFTNGDLNSLMTPKADQGEANHNPGPIVLAMLGDMGWDHVWINHTPQKDSEDLLSSVRITAQVESDSPLTGNPVLAYRIPVEQTNTEETATPETEVQPQAFTSIPMIYDPITATYFQDIALDGMAKNFEYYIQANASAGRIFQSPVKGETQPLGFSVGPDTTIPVLAHFHNQEYVFSNVPSLTLLYQATDNLGLSSLVTEIWLDGNPLEPIVYAPTPDETVFWTSVPVENLGAYQTLQYRFTATDSSVAQNQATLPTEGFFSLTIEPIYDAVLSYANNFDTATPDFLLDGFEISTPEGFANGTLGTKHPYDNTGTSRINTYAYLRQQIQLQAGTSISFDQVVLIEPGEDGAVYPSEDLYDFVVVEASKDQGTTWIAIESGWDSTEHTDFLTSYNANTDESNNSTTQGTSSMYKPKTVSFANNPNFTENDVVMIRFRLLSDPLAIGWGWTIDNLEIGATMTP